MRIVLILILICFSLPVNCQKDTSANYNWSVGGGFLYNYYKHGKVIPFHLIDPVHPGGFEKLRKNSFHLKILVEKNITRCMFISSGLQFFDRNMIFDGRKNIDSIIVNNLYFYYNLYDGAVPIYEEYHSNSLEMPVIFSVKQGKFIFGAGSIFNIMTFNYSIKELNTGEMYRRFRMGFFGEDYCYGHVSPVYFTASVSYNAKIFKSLLRFYLNADFLNDLRFEGINAGVLFML